MGVGVYFIHKSDDINQPTREYWYGTQTYTSDSDDNSLFDIRELAGEPPDGDIFRLSSQWGCRGEAEDDADRIRIIANITNGHIQENYMAGETIDPDIGYVRQRVPLVYPWCYDTLDGWGSSWDDERELR